MKKNPTRKTPLPSALAPELDYAPPSPKSYRPRIGLIGCGGITKHHLQAYRDAGWEVVAFFDPNPQAALDRRDEFYPGARICKNLGDLLDTPGLDVVDIATHPKVRGTLIEQSLRAGKHVLSQKPFVTDLREGERLARLASESRLKLAVNQNGRWAPYFAYMRSAVRSGLIGKISSISIQIDWDHTWCKGTAFEKIPHLVLYDFGIHWFDAAHSFLGGTPVRSVFAATASAAGQPISPPLVATANVAFEGGIASLRFNGCSPHLQRETCTIVGEKGALYSEGGVCGPQAVTHFSSAGQASPKLSGAWFPDGFRGAMGELLCAIEEGREPENGAMDNLKSLSICLAATRSADERRPVVLDRPQP